MAIPSPQAQSEAEMAAITILLERSASLRRRLLVVVIALAFGGGTGAAFLYVGVAYVIYGRVVGAAFAAGALLTFTILHRLSRPVARLRDEVDPEALVEAAAMLG